MNIGAALLSRGLRRERSVEAHRRFSHQALATVGAVGSAGM